MTDAIDWFYVKEVIAGMPEDFRNDLAEYIYTEIKHGDFEHKRWLGDKLNTLFNATIL